MPDQDQDIPRAMPPAIADLLCGTSLENSELTLPPLFNPWAPKVEGDGRLSFEPEDGAEQELRNALAPIEKLFAGSAITTASTSEPRFRFSKSPTPAPKEDWDSPLAKSATAKREESELTYKTRRDEDGFVWREGFSADEELKYAMLVTDEQTASLLLLKSRVDEKLTES